MNKQELIAELANKAGIDKNKSADFIDALTVTIKDGLKRGDKVIISGLGTFMLIKRNAYKGRNPRTGEPMDYPEQILPHFKPSDILKDSIN